MVGVWYTPDFSGTPVLINVTFADQPSAVA